MGSLQRNCSYFGKPASGHDAQPPRLFQFVPFWGFFVYFEYAMKRVNCKTCGVKVERVPWGDGKKLITYMFACCHFSSFENRRSDIVPLTWFLPDADSPFGIGIDTSCCIAIVQEHGPRFAWGE